MPKSVSGTIDDRTYQKMKALGLKPSDIIPRVLEWYVNNQDPDAARIFMINHTYAEIQKIEQEIRSIKQKEHMLRLLKKQYNRLKEMQTCSNGEITLYDLTTYLNKRIIAYHYDYDEIMRKQADVIKEIRSLNPKFNLRKQIDEVRLLKERVIG